MDKNCAVMCTDNDTVKLKTAVAGLQDKNIYNQLVINSLNLAAQHDIHSVRERFRETLCGFLN